MKLLLAPSQSRWSALQVEGLGGHGPDPDRLPCAADPEVWCEQRVAHSGELRPDPAQT